MKGWLGKKLVGWSKEYLKYILKISLFADAEVALQRVLTRQKDKIDKVPLDRIYKNIERSNNKEALIWFHYINTTHKNPLEVYQEGLDLMN